MNKRAIVTLLLGLMSIGLLWFVLLRPQPQVPIAAAADAATNSSPNRARAVLPVVTHSNIEPLGASPSPAQVVEYFRARKDQINREAENEISMWQAPILYFGKVVDENNQPISGVQVSYSASAMNESRKEIENTGVVTSDGRGIFKIDGVRGIGLMLQLSHPGYYAYPENSTGFDKRSVPKKGYFSDSEENAELFRMHSKSHPVPLVHHTGGLNVPLDGTPTKLNMHGAEKWTPKFGQ